MLPIKGEGIGEARLLLGDPSKCDLRINSDGIITLVTEVALSVENDEDVAA